MNLFPPGKVAGLGPAAPALPGVLLGMALVLSGCTSKPPVNPVLEPATPPVVSTHLRETPPPVGHWRPHQLAECPPDTSVSKAVERYLGTCSEYFRGGSGSDAMIEMEMGLEQGNRHSLMLLTLGQLYLLAGQGNPDLLPNEGPAADVGDWERNKTRLLKRAEDVLLEAAETRSFDAAVDYLLADVDRAQGDPQGAAEWMTSGIAKCTGGRSFGILWLYQDLNNYPPRYLGGPSPEYPQAALGKGVAGDVILDVLVSPAGEVRQLVAVDSPADSLTRAAETSLRKGRFEAARVGKYPIWSWLRVTTAFHLEG
jgi:TonB family protein